MNAATDFQNIFLTAKETAKLLNVKHSTIRSLCFRKEIPFVKVGRLVRFDRTEILNWVKASHSQSTSTTTVVGMN